MKKLIISQTAATPVVIDSSASLVLEPGVKAVVFEKPTSEMTIEVTLKENSELTFISICNTSTNTKRTITLQGKGSAYSEHTILVGKGNDKIDITSTVINEAKESKAKVEVRGVLDGNSQAHVVGNMRVKHGACKSDSRLSQHLLLLDNARAEAFPYLEIDENDVTAGHAATVRPIDPEHLFYLRSRGLSENEARALLVQSFVMPAILGLPEAIRKQVEQQLGELHVLLA